MPRPVNLGPRAVRTNDGKWERGEPVELDADALVRHAFVCGASGAGKTVFSKGLVEEAVLAGIPVVAVDLKGDLASLALTGAHADPTALAAVFGDEGPAVAAEYRAGAERHGVDLDRARRYADQAAVRLFTPNSSLGRRVALSALPSFPDPPASALEREERDELIQALVLGFAHSMYGSPAAVKKNEPAVKVVEELVRWCANRGEPLEGAAGVSRILELVREPPFDAMGGMPLEQYLPLRDKQRLMQKLNSRLLGAERSRYEGPRLSIETLLDGVPAGKTPLSIVYLGHISDFTEQASILGLLCADVYRWMRKTGGSSGARLLLYVDELGGGDAKHAFYPSAPHNPPSKAPLNLLVRQGRSAGVAMLLATQNPMSVDVRGLGNINTWAIGRLTRKNDHARIEDLLARLPEGPPTPTQVVSQLPQGVMLTMSDALSGPTYVFGRWLYSVHRQLSPGAVGTISQLTDPRVEEPLAPPAPLPAPLPAPVPVPAQVSAPVPPPVVAAAPDIDPETDQPVRVAPRPRAAPAPAATTVAPAEPAPPKPKRTRAKRAAEGPPPAPLELIPTPLPDAHEPTSTTLRMTRPHAAPGRGGDDSPEADLDTDEVRITDEIPATDEHTRAGTTRRWTSRGVSVDADTHALHTAASRAAEPTAAAPIVAPPDEPRPKRQRRKKAAEVAEPASPEPRPVTGSHPVRADAGATTVLRPRPRPRPDPTLETAALLADDPEPSELETRREPTRTAWIPNTARSGWIVHHGGRSWAVDGDRPLVIGRSPLADAQLPDRNVSRKHLELRPDGVGLTLTSLKSDNPIWLDGRPLTEVTRLEPKQGTWTLKLGNSEVLLTWANPRR